MLNHVIVSFKKVLIASIHISSNIELQMSLIHPWLPKTKTSSICSVINFWDIFFFEFQPQMHGLEESCQNATP